MTTALQTRPGQRSIEAALGIFHVKGDDYRQCFKDRLEALRHDQSPHAVSSLLDYASAIETQVEESAVAVALSNVILHMSQEYRDELLDILIETLYHCTPEAKPRWRLRDFAYQLCC